MKKKRICYYCGKEGSTTEHVPPKLMFRGFKCDSITVRSCEKHNCEKGGHDQAIVSALLIPLKNRIDTTSLNDIEPDINKAIRLANSSFGRTKYQAYSKPFIGDYPKELENQTEVSFIKEEMKIENWINNLTAGLVYHGTNLFDETINWDSVKNWRPNYFNCSNELKLQEAFDVLQKNAELKKCFDHNDWIKGWSASPTKYPENIYKFYVALSDKTIIFQHIFYNNYSWYAWFNPSQLTRELLINKLECKLKNTSSK